MRLPYDVFGLIFEKLLEPDGRWGYDSDYHGCELIGPTIAGVKTLLNCSLLCRGLRRCCQSLVFRHIELDDKTDEEKFKALATATSKNPALGPSVRHLRLRLNGTAYHGHLVRFLSKITNLSSFILLLRTDTEDIFVNWSCLSKSLRAVLEKIITTHSLSTFSISRATFPVVQILPSLTSVQHLSLDLVKDSRNAIPLTTGRSLGQKRDEVVKPRGLTITPNFAYPLLKLTQFDWSNIQWLILSPVDYMPYTQGEIETTKEILSKTPNLRSMEISPQQGVTGDLSSVFSKVDAKLFDSLERLDLCLEWNDNYDDPPFPFDHAQDPYMGFVEALSTFPPGNKLRSIYLNIRFHFEDVPAFEFDPERWTRIDEIPKPSAFPCLKSMSLSFFFTCDPEIASEVGEIMDRIDSLSWGDLGASRKLDLTFDHDIKFDDASGPGDYN